MATGDPKYVCRECGRRRVEDYLLWLCPSCSYHYRNRKVSLATELTEREAMLEAMLDAMEAA